MASRVGALLLTGPSLRRVSFSGTVRRNLESRFEVRSCQLLFAD